MAVKDAAAALAVAIAMLLPMPNHRSKPAPRRSRRWNWAGVEPYCSLARLLRRREAAALERFRAPDDLGRIAVLQDHHAVRTVTLGYGTLTAVAPAWAVQIAWPSVAARPALVAVAAGASGRVRTMSVPLMPRPRRARSRGR